MKRKCAYLAAPAAVMLLMLSVFCVCQMYPFGMNSLSWCDMNQQVIPFLLDFKDILAGKANMFLNMQNCGGMNFWGGFLFFISSPFSFLVALVDKAGIYQFVNILVLLKMMTCALTAEIFFRYRFKNLTLMQSTALSVMYAFCGYTMFYYQNHVWLDMMYLFPVLLIGLDRLIQKERAGLYIFSYTAMLTVNFYLSYMVTIFLVLSFGLYIYFFAPRERRRKVLLLFEISTLVVALLTAVVWLPALMQYVQSARTGNLFTSLRVGTFFTRFDTTLVVILCTSAVFSAVVMYLLFVKKQTETAAFSFYIFLLMMTPVLIEPVNKMWHTGNYQAFPVRYGYITVFFGLILLAVIISGINEDIRFSHSRIIPLFGAMLAGGAVFIAVWLILYKDYHTVTVYTRTLWGNSESLRLLLAFFLTAALAYFVLLLLYRYRQLSKAAFSVLLCLVVLLEAVFHSSVYIASAAHSERSALPVIELGGKIQDDTLYRVKTEKKYFDVNLVGGIGYATLSHYTSLTNESFLYTMKKLGYSSYWMEVNSNGGTKLTDAILGNKYTIVQPVDLQGRSDIVYGNDKYEIVKNEITLPVGFVMDSNSIEALKNLPDTSRLNLQQAIFESVFHTDEKLFVNYEPSAKTNIEYQYDNNRYSLTFQDNSKTGMLIYHIPVKEKQTLYFDCFDKLSNNLIEHINSSFNVFVNGKLVQEDYPSQMNNGLLALGTFQDEMVEVEIEVLKEVDAKSFGLAGLKDDVLKQAVGRTTAAQLKQDGNQIVGTATANDNHSWLFLPITADDGFTAMVNHKNTEIQRVLGSWMAVKLQKGENRIIFSYLPTGFKTGLLLSAAGILLCIVWYRFLKNGSYRRIQFLELPGALAFTVLFFAVLFAVYLFPVGVYFFK
ncbi:MAG: YfhO family protein [Clostridiales bacterium]|nr:YfhO family protein [Clostridiales bacterium]